MIGRPERRVVMLLSLMMAFLIMVLAEVSLHLGGGELTHMIYER